MDIDTARDLLDHANDDLQHLVVHFSTIVSSIAEARTKIAAVSGQGFFVGELRNVLGVLENASKSVKSAGDGVAIARARVREINGGPPDGIAMHATD